MRAAVPDDASGAAACVKAAYEHYVERNGKVPGPMRDDYDALIAEHDVTVAERRGALSQCSCSKRPRRGSSSTTSPWRRPSRARAWAAICSDWRRRRRSPRGHDSIYLYTQEIMVENLALYERVGYVEYARRHELGLDRIYMRKQLTPGGDAQPRSPV